MANAIVERLGDGALRIARPADVDGASLIEAARAWPGVVDAWLTESWLAVSFADDARADVDAARIDALETLGSTRTESAEPTRTIEIAVRYDGVDLEAVARECDLVPSRVIELHLHAEYTVLFLGFQPGFAYLGGLPRELHVARLATPRARVPKNAVAIAGAYAGVYPFESAGGWRILGTAPDAKLFDLDRGALLRAGDRVRFVRAP
jgi:KipI family sensor histidine kinase inhibitor